jgi:hypothetical protein
VPFRRLSNFGLSLVHLTFFGRTRKSFEQGLSSALPIKPKLIRNLPRNLPSVAGALSREWLFALSFFYEAFFTGEALGTVGCEDPMVLPFLKFYLLFSLTLPLRMLVVNPTDT